MIRRPCLRAGCSELVEHGFCEAHARQKKSPPPPRPGIYDARWAKQREAWRAANPLCEACLSEGRTREMDDVDHVIPIRGSLTLLRAGWNLQSLCRPCHAKKTGRDRGWSDLIHPLPTVTRPDLVVVAGPPLAWTLVAPEVYAGRRIVELEAIYREQGVVPAMVTIELTKNALAERNRRLATEEPTCLIVGAPRRTDRLFWAEVWRARVVVRHPGRAAVLGKISDLASDHRERAARGLESYLLRHDPVAPDETVELIGSERME